MGDEGTMEEVQSRLVELIDELKRAGAFAEARWFKAQTEGLSQDIEARRTVNRLITRLARFRTGSDEIPETPALLIVVCRLEDACAAVLKAGFVPAARPTWGSRLRRWSMVSVLALLAGLGSLGLAVAFVDYGHLLFREPSASAGPMRLRRGEQASHVVRMSSAPRLPQAVKGVEFTVASGCRGDRSIDGFVCSRASGHGNAEQGPVAMELKQDQRAYGVEFVLLEPRMDAGRGVVTVVATASVHTPPGLYRLRLEGAYRGYGPDPDCLSVLDRLGLCEYGPSAARRQLRVRVPDLVIEVSTERFEAEQQDERIAQQREQAQRHAQQQAEVLARAAEVEVILADNERVLQQREFAELRPRLERLTQLLSEGPEEGVSDASLSRLREQLAVQRGQLVELDRRLFEALYTALYEHPGRSVDEEQVIRRLAKRFSVSVDEVRFVQLDQAERIAERLAAVAQTQQAQLQAAQRRLGARCGPVPSHTWSDIHGLLQQRVPAHRGAEPQLLQCLTPRLTAEHCWEVICDHAWIGTNVDGTPSRAQERSRFGFSAGRGRFLGSVTRRFGQGEVAGIRPAADVAKRHHEVQ